MIIPAFIGNLRGWEWLIIFLVILLLFGGKKIPELMRGVGKGLHAFKQGMKEAKDELERPIDESPKSGPAAPEAKESDEKLGKDRS